MNLNVIAKAYWRAVKRGTRIYEAVPEKVQPYVLLLAQEELETGGITQEEYAGWIEGRALA